MKFQPLILCLSACMISMPISAAPPSRTPLCYVEGTIITFERKEAYDPKMMLRFQVPVLVLEVKAIRPKEEGEKGCTFPEAAAMPRFFEGKKSLGFYRLCDRSKKLYPRYNITGLVGRQIDQGPICIDEINYATKKME